MPGKLKIIQGRRKGGRQTDTSGRTAALMEVLEQREEEEGEEDEEREEGEGREERRLLMSWDGTGFVPGDEVSVCVCSRSLGVPSLTSPLSSRCRPGDSPTAKRKTAPKTNSRQTASLTLTSFPLGGIGTSARLSRR